MTIDEAIDQLRTECCVPNSVFQEPKYQAIALGIEALKTRKNFIDTFGYNYYKLLPGETPTEPQGRRADELKKLQESPLGRKPKDEATCPYKRLRDYPACYEDCPDVEQCHYSKHPKG